MSIFNYFYPTRILPCSLLLSCSFTVPLLGSLYPNLDDEKEAPQSSIFQHTHECEEQEDYVPSFEKDIQKGFQEDMKAFEAVVKNKEETLFLLLVLKNKKGGKSQKYFFSTTSFTDEKELQEVVSDRSYLPIETNSKHLILGLLRFFHASQKDYTVEEAAVNKKLCKKCNFLASNFLGFNLESSKNGCLAHPFPTSEEIKEFSSYFTDDICAQLEAFSHESNAENKEWDKSSLESWPLHTEAISSECEYYNDEVEPLSLVETLKEKLSSLQRQFQEYQINTKDEISRLEAEAKRLKKQLEENEQKQEREVKEKNLTSFFELLIEDIGSIALSLDKDFSKLEDYLKNKESVDRVESALLEKAWLKVYNQPRKGALYRKDISVNVEISENKIIIKNDREGHEKFLFSYDLDKVFKLKDCEWNSEEYENIKCEKVVTRNGVVSIVWDKPICTKISNKNKPEYLFETNNSNCPDEGTYSKGFTGGKWVGTDREGLIKNAIQLTKFLYRLKRVKVSVAL